MFYLITSVSSHKVMKWAHVALSYALGFRQGGNGCVAFLGSFSDTGGFGGGGCAQYFGFLFIIHW
jgi:hypothetical protein